MWGYRKRLERDLARWREAGWISSEAQALILKDVAGAGHGLGLPAALAILAAVLIGFAVMSFVAANWQDMPRLVRLALLLAMMWGAYGFAALLFRRGLDIFAHAAVLAGASVFGASIMLVSQMYHIDGNPPDAVLAWGIGTLLAGLAFRSNAALAFSLILFTVWGYWEMGRREEVFWPYLLAWVASVAAFGWQRWAPGAHLAGLGFAGFVVMAGYVWDGGHAHELVVTAGLLLGATMIACNLILPHLRAGWMTGLLYAYLIAFAGILAMQFVESPELSPFIAEAVFALALSLAAVWWGLLSHDRAILWFGYAGFSIEILSIYAKTVGTLMGTSVFFLSAGLVVAALAYLAFRLHQRGQLTEAVR